MFYYSTLENVRGLNSEDNINPLIRLIGLSSDPLGVTLEQSMGGKLQRIMHNEDNPKFNVFSEGKSSLVTGFLCTGVSSERFRKYIEYDALKFILLKHSLTLDESDYSLTLMTRLVVVLRMVVT